MESISARKSKATSSGKISLEPHATSYIFKAPFTSHGKHVFSYDLLVKVECCDYLIDIFLCNQTENSLRSGMASNFSLLTSEHRAWMITGAQY